MGAFAPRSCPLCGTAEGTTLVALAAAEFCDANWTYDPAWRTLLTLPDDAEYPLRRCGSCSFVYASLLPDEQFLQLLYDRVIVKESCVAGSEHSGGYATRLRYVADLLQLAGDHVPALDYGSGAGVTLRILRACNVDAYGFDPSGMRAGYSRETGAPVLTDRQSLVEHGPFAMIVLDNVLEHIPDPVEAIRFIASNTRSAAVAFVSVPSYEDDDLQREVSRRARGEKLSMTLNPWEHLNYFSLASLDRLMARGGFVPIRSDELPRVPEIGLRPETALKARAKNAAATLVRLARWAATGRALASTEWRYYRKP